MDYKHLLNKLRLLEDKLDTLQEEISLLSRNNKQGYSKCKDGKCDKNHYIIDEQTGAVLIEYNGYYTNAPNNFGAP